MTNPKTAAQSADKKLTLPERYRQVKFLTFEDVMTKEWMAETGQWLYSQKGLFRRSGDKSESFHYGLPNIDDLHEPFNVLKKEIVLRLDDVLESFGATNFDIEGLETHASLHHHGGRSDWRVDLGADDEARMLSFGLFMHADPCMFSGGELEFVDGTTIEAKHNRLVIFDSRQQHRVRRVECWSAEFLHGRWAIFGWIHGRENG